MLALLQQEIQKHGDRGKILPIDRLHELRRDIEDFTQHEELNGFQAYITSRLYQFDLPATDFAIRSIIIIASPNPAYANVKFHWRGATIPVLGLARSYPGKYSAPTATKRYLTRLLKTHGYHLHPAPQLPLKRLAVRSGLAEYGRNNICYVEGMGSFFTFSAYFSDVPCTEDHWHEIRHMAVCRQCTLCFKQCPTGAIRPDRFLINNERCLSYFNESPGDFPEWLPKSVHHCLYDCLLCQRNCPQNKAYITNVIGPLEFDDAETEMLLSGKAMRVFPRELKKKVRFLGMDSWLKAIPRNMRVLFENYEGQP